MKGVGIGGKRWISIPGFRGYVTARLNPWRREQKRLMRQDFYLRKKEAEKRWQSGLSTVVRSSPCAIRDNGRVAVARAQAESWNSPEQELQRMKNRAQTKIRGNRNLRKKLIKEHGNLQAAIEYVLLSGEQSFEERQRLEA